MGVKNVRWTFRSVEFEFMLYFKCSFWLFERIIQWKVKKWEYKV